MKNEDPFFRFDWYFSDTSEVDGARFHALKSKSEETKILMELINTDSLIHFALWEELPENHPVGQLWLETQTDLLATIYLAYGGFFRQALTVLRAWFEIAVHGVFFSGHYGSKTGRYEQWRQGNRNAPAKIDDISRSLATRKDMLIKTDEAMFLAKLGPIYKFLSQQTHAQGLDIINLQEGRDNVPRYLPKSYDIWYEKILESFNAVCFLYRIFFTKDIASYLKKSREESERLKIHQKKLGGFLIDYNILVDEIMKIV